MNFIGHKSKIASLLETELPKVGQTVTITIADKDPYKGAKKKRQFTVYIVNEYPEKFLTVHVDNDKHKRTECFLKTDLTYGVIDFKVIG
ncbi:hypothetical protein [Wukongibacter baidiensis]